LQDNLEGRGRPVLDILAMEPDETVDLYLTMLHETLKLYRHARERAREGVLIGIDSNPSNWWIMHDGSPVFFDTTPPLISLYGKIEVDALVPKEHPSFLGKIFGALARIWPISRLSEKVIRQYAFDWPTMIRTLLVKTVYEGRSFRDALVDKTRAAVSELGEGKVDFLRKLTGISIAIELMKYRIFNWFAAIGGYLGRKSSHDADVPGA
jgi:hypothetical protein